MALIAAIWPTLGMAGAFSVTPVRIYMTPRDRAVAVTIVNEGDAELVLQADLNVWSQTATGTDEQTATEDLILSPPILRLAPQARQVVRLALLRAHDPTRQLTYRMIVREIPEALRQPSAQMQIPVALALSLPVFVTPATARRQLSCELGGVGETEVRVACANRGGAYAQVRQVLVKRGDQVLARFEGGTYILPNASQVVACAAAHKVAPGAVQLVVMLDDGQAETFDVDVK
ncbi:fimbrial biogenesis chaperone [Variovorax saccharolyticus]|uniref:fimbrial biogenesis chaperone n=1 Tax=Variovorax saccharolyticus TaxID=3053516 RepID=UPI0025790613|nr:fimbria/pilus periplasmic chaperone [Variovorax sp. J31P216]